VAARITRVTGDAVRYENLSRAAHEQLLTTSGGLPPWLARHIVELDAFAALVPEQLNDTLQRVLGRYPRTMDEFLQEHRTAFARLTAV
jgi:regulator of protease activity HflC (stomatin/prohibitin superfamily)